MAEEIERKFLVKGSYKNRSFRHTFIKQGYISSVPGRTVRIRIREDKGYITIKGNSNVEGTSRFEWEKEISVKDAEELFRLCEPGIIEKTRYEIKAGKHVFEVDEFSGDNDGLIVAEIELNDESEKFVHPDWLGKEVTGKRQYYNSHLVKNPYKQW